MASDLIPLWSPALHKEALDLMVAAWSTLPEKGRVALVERIIAGPQMPEKPAEDQEGRERQQRWFDRRIFERLALLERRGEPPLPQQGQEKLGALRRLYPRWRIEEGIRAHFSSWMESSGGPESDRSPEDLLSLSGSALVDALRAESQEREGRLSVWGQVVGGRPGRGIGLLLRLSAEAAGGDDAIWSDTLYGLRHAMDRPAVARRVVDLLISAPDEIVSSPRLFFPTSDALEVASKQQPLPISEERFLQLWDRLADTCMREAPEDPPEKDDWVGRAINRPIGRLTTALLNVMFKRGLKAGAGLPEVFKVRLNRLATDQPDSLRLARVILASRLLYLFAIDPAWTRERLLPGFDWQRSEDEATALWDGYGWGARINAELWAELSFPLYDAFTPERTARLGRTSGTLASLLMVAGVEFPVAVVPTDRSRRAIRAMSAGDREAAASWLYSFLAGPPPTDQKAPPGAERAGRADRIWAERVLPWVRRVWPRDADLVTPGTSDQFALLAIATDDQFPEAVGFLLPYMTGSDSWGYIVHNVLRSRHPTDHPEAVLQLLGKVVVLGGLLFTNDLRAVLDRIAAAQPKLRQNSAYRTFDASLRAAGR
jgi:hypothetical protein